MPQIPLDDLYKLAPEKDRKPWDNAIAHLKQEMTIYKALVDPAPPAYNPSTSASPNTAGATTTVAPEVLNDHVTRVSDAMRAVGDAHPDPEVRNQWHEHAEELKKAEPSKALEILKDIGMGLGILIVTPVAVALATVVGVVYGVGKVLQGVGGLLTFGGALDGKWGFGS